MIGIYWGLFFITFQLDFLYLNYILPAAGYMVLYLQLRKCSAINESFQKAFRYAVALLFYEIGSFGISATPLALESNVVILLAVMGTVLQAAMLLHLRKALMKEYRNAGIDDERNHWLIWLVVLKLSLFAVVFIGAGILASLIAMAVILIGLYRYLRDTEAALFSEEKFAEEDLVRGRQPLILWTAYTVAIFLAAAGSAYFGQISFQELLPLEKADSQALVNKGMPAEIADCLSKEDIEKLEHAENFKILKSYQKLGGPDTEIISVSGLTDYDRYITVVWFSRKNEKQFSKDVLAIEGDTAGIYDGRIVYTKADGKKVCRDIDMSEIGSLRDPGELEEYYFDYDSFSGYLEVPVLRSAKEVSAYLILDVGFNVEEDGADEWEGFGVQEGKFTASWYGLKRVCFPYLQTPEAINRQAYDDDVKYFYVLNDSFVEIES